MLSAPIAAPSCLRYSCSKNGTSAAAFSTGISAPLATFSITKSCAAALVFARVGEILGTVACRAEAVVMEEAGAFPALETYFFAFVFFVLAGFEAVGETAAPIAAAA